MAKRVSGNDTTLRGLSALKPLAVPLTTHLCFSTATMSGLAGPHLLFTGATAGSVNALGNLIVGYNEEPAGLSPADRGGSHNLVVGNKHRYSAFGGFVAKLGNTAGRRHSSVSGGAFNTASGEGVSVSGGANNFTRSEKSSVSEGAGNQASSGFSSISAAASIKPPAREPATWPAAPISA